MENLPEQLKQGQTQDILSFGVDVIDQVVARQRADFLAKASTLLAASLDYETTLSTIAGLAIPALADWCIVDILDQNQNFRRVAVTHSDPDKAGLAQELKNLIPDLAKSHPVSQVLTTGQAIKQFNVESFPKEAMFGHSDYWSVADRMELRSRLIVPMSINGKVLGAISLIYSRPGRFYNEADLQFALELARRAALAVENARLYQVEQQARRQEVFLNEVNSSLAQSLDYVKTLQSITRLLVPGLADYCVIDLLDETGQSRWVASHHFDPEKLKLLHKLQDIYQATDNPKSLIRQAMLAQKVSLVEMIEPEQTAQLAPTNEIAQLALAVATRSLIILPMVVRNQVIGTITLGLTKGGNRPDSEHYTKTDVDLTEEVARRATVAIDNARLYQQSQQAAERSARLHQMAVKLAGAVSITEVNRLVLAQFQEAVGASAGSIVHISEDATLLEIIHSVGYPQEVIDRWQPFPVTTPVPLGECILEKRAIFVENLETAGYLKRYPLLIADPNFNPNRTLAALPLIIEEQIWGAIGLTFPPQHHFTPEERQFMLTLAGQSALALERARLYEEAQQAVQTQKELDHLKDLFISIVSHELRNPLASIKGFGQLMQRNLRNAAETSPSGQERRTGQDKLLHQVETIVRQANRMNQLIKELLDFSRLQNQKLELNLEPGLNLIEMIKQVIEQQQVASEEKCRLVLQADESTIKGRWDVGRVEQVLTNLISNAIKYSPPNSQIVVGVKQVLIPSSQGRAAPNAAEECEVLVWVKDEGQGISPENQASLFNRFYRVRTQENVQVDGLGLGLYISHEIVTQHGGRMWLESEVEKGSTFYFSLPLENRLL